MASLHILEALDNLNALVDAPSIEQIEVTEDAHLVAHLQQEESDYWVAAGSDELTRDALRETFKSVHEYLMHFYEQMRRNEEDPRRLIEGINSVMVLVGEAAAKLQRHGVVFTKALQEVSEYEQLQNFYKERVVKELFTDFAKEPAQKTVEEEVVEERAGVHLLDDIEVVKRDHLYELFFLKNEANQDFYTLQLARNLKLACDFGAYQERFTGMDPFVQVKSWEDRSLHLFAKRLLSSAQSEIKAFYQKAGDYRDHELVSLMNQALMALFLAANPRNLLRQFSKKGCYLYFHDFQLFLREALHTREYERLLVYSDPEPYLGKVMQLIAVLVNGFFQLGRLSEEARRVVIEIAQEDETQLSDSLLVVKEALNSCFAQHPNGPIFKALDSVRGEKASSFDPLYCDQYPHFECSMGATTLICLPAPIFQHQIDQAEVTEEFRAFLRSHEKTMTLINFQDRTSWREHARSKALEEAGQKAEFVEALTVVTLAKDTEFYDQKGPYEELRAGEFIEQFAHHLLDEKTGYFFPHQLEGVIVPTWTAKMLQRVHELFFGEREALSQKERTDFISLAYILIELKLIDILQPSILAHCSKDGLDSSNEASSALIAFLKENRWNSVEKEWFFTLLFVPTMMQRERIVLPECIERLHSLFLLLEKQGSYLDALSDLFNHPFPDISFEDNSNRGQG